MTKGKMILGALTAILTAGSLFAFNVDNKRSGGLRLYTTSAANGCRLANCWTAVNKPNPSPCPTATYFTQITSGGKCKNTFSGLKTTSN